MVEKDGRWKRWTIMLDKCIRQLYVSTTLDSSGGQDNTMREKFWIMGVRSGKGTGICC